MSSLEAAQSFNNASLAQTVHLCIDLQRSYINNVDVPIERHIGREIAPRLSKLGIPTYWVYYDTPMRHAFFMGSYRNQPKTSFQDLSDFVRKRDGDLILPKHETTAMTSTDVIGALDRNKKTRLLISGFAYAVCVKDTSTDAARMGYDVTLLTDGTDYDPDFDFIESPLRQNGVKFSTFKETLCSLSL